MDRREMAWDPFHGTFDEKTMTGTLFGDETKVHCHYEVCPVCDGKGTHVNPSIDSHGITADEFYDDPDFAESYMSGLYDVACYECRGTRVIPVPDDDDPNKGEYEEAVRDHYQYLGEIEAERRAGA